MIVLGSVSILRLGPGNQAGALSAPNIIYILCDYGYRNLKLVYLILIFCKRMQKN